MIAELQVVEKYSRRCGREVQERGKEVEDVVGVRRMDSERTLLFERPNTKGSPTFVIRNLDSIWQLMRRCEEVA